MNWIDRLLGKPKTPSKEDPVGPIGGSQRPVSPTNLVPVISPGNPGGTYAPLPRDIPPLAVQTSPLNSMGIPNSPDYGNQLQRDYWPTEVHREANRMVPPAKGKGPDPNWTPEDFDPQRPSRPVYSFNRPWRLAVPLDGNRTYSELSDLPVPSVEGYVGLRAAPRASMFTEPAPWGTDVIATTRESGTPTNPGNATTPSSVVYSPSQFAGSNNRSYRLQ